MQYRELGETGLVFSCLGYGTLTFSRMQKDLTADAATKLLQYGASCGINWLDTAEYYENYELLAPFLGHEGLSTAVVTKTYAYDEIGATASLEKARKALDRDVIDVFMLHEQISKETLSGHRRAFQTLLDAKARGLIRAVGVSTHSTAVASVLASVKAGTDNPDPDFPLEGYEETDVIFLLLSQSGIGLLDGSRDEMTEAAKACRSAGMAVLGMKLFGGGHLLYDRAKAVNYAKTLDFVSAWAVGMADESEIAVNTAWLSFDEPQQEALRRSAALPRTLSVAPYCVGCGRCVQRCRSKAMTLQEGRAVVDPKRCTLCGYCAATCPEFAIKVI